MPKKPKAKPPVGKPEDVPVEAEDVPPPGWYGGLFDKKEDDDERA